MNTFESKPPKKEVLSDELLAELSEKKEQLLREYMGDGVNKDVLMLKALVEKLAQVSDNDAPGVLQVFDEERRRIMDNVPEQKVYSDGSGVVRTERLPR